MLEKEWNGGSALASVLSVIFFENKNREENTPASVLTAVTISNNLESTQQFTVHLILLVGSIDGE
jgi:hypothetical protein